MFKHLSLTNIKSFHRAEIPLSNFTVLLGTNASGKSNIGDALRFLQGASRGYKLIDILAGEYEGGSQIWRGIRGGPNEFIRHGEKVGGIEAHVDRATQSRYGIEIENANGGPPSLRDEWLYKGDLKQFSTRDDAGNHVSVVATPIGSGADPELAIESNMTLDQVPLLWQVPFLGFPFAQVSSEAPRVAFHAATEFKDMRFMDLSPDSIKEPTFPGQIVLGDRGENLASVLQYLVEHQHKEKDLIEWIRALTPMDIAGFEFPIDSRGRVSVALLEHDNRRTSAESASDGTLRFLAYLALKFSTNVPTACFIDEIETGIHPARLALLVELLENQSIHRNLQIIATSHSPALVSLLREETLMHSLLVHRGEHAQSSNVTPLRDLPRFHEVVKRRRAGDLMESAWFENTIEAMEYSDVAPD